VKSDLENSPSALTVMSVSAGTYFLLAKAAFKGDLHVMNKAIYAEIIRVT